MAAWDSNVNRQSVISSDEEDRATLASPRVLELQGRQRMSGYWSVNTANRSSMTSNILEAQIEAADQEETATVEGPQATISTPFQGRRNSLNKEAMSPAPQGEKILCRIVRRKEPGMQTRYDLYREDGQFGTTFMLSAYRKRRGKGSYYVITTSQNPSPTETILGKVKSNFIGTQFTIYDNGASQEKNADKELRQELGSVFYDPNILGFKGPRKMTVLLMGMTKEGKRPEFRPSCDSETLVEKYHAQNDNRLLVLRNKAPQWNEETQSYVLNFSGRVTLASVKNFQIVHSSDLDYIVLQFGRIAESTFTLDYQYPLCPLQAFAIALSSFDAKLACE
ncbi:hypothetical protein DSO57_1032202 [Entomophthora muscae]|uniref:Uncharacterized protein n=1 Tax=Entomophthora muscae TaxID=34485 RepID=A0ACC2SDR4_9FUNG|nr:hypothetical protein DSO57_1032202 [Entomophthora muscae]